MANHYKCTREIEYQGKTYRPEIKVAGGFGRAADIFIGAEPKCGKGTSLAKPEKVSTKDGKTITIPAAFKLIGKPKK